MRKTAPHHRRSSHGSVFIVVLVVSLGLVSLAVFFGNSMMMAYRGSDNELAGRQAEQAIEGAARYAEYLVNSGTSPGTFPDPASYQSEAVPVGDATFWFIGNPATTGSGSTGQQLDRPVFGLIDEASKLNLNTASSTMLQQLLQQIPGTTPDLAASIVESRKVTGTNSVPADSSVSTFSNGPVKHAPFESTQELALLTGTDQSLLCGQDANLNHVLEAGEGNTAQSFISNNLNGGFGLLEYVTVFSREPNIKSDGTPRINVGNFTGLTPPLRGLLNALGGNRPTEIEKQIQTKLGASRTTRIGSVLEFFILSGMTEAEFSKVSDSLTVSSAPFQSGLINVNTAPAAVLECIPGIAGKSAQLIAARQNQAPPSTNLAWVVPILTPAGAVKAGPYLTTRSFQVCADVAAVGHNGRGYRRAQFIIDSAITTGTSQIIYRRNLAGLGWALGPDARAALANSTNSQ